MDDANKESLEALNARKAEDIALSSNVVADSLENAVKALFDFIDNELEVPAAKKPTLKALSAQVTQMLDKNPQ